MTVILTGVDALPAKVEDPLYVATTESLPSGRAVVAREATPLLLNVTFPRTVDPTVNVTVPVGTLLVDATGSTATESVTDFPTATVAVEACKVVVVANSAGAVTITVVAVGVVLAPNADDPA